MSENWDSRGGWANSPEKRAQRRAETSRREPEASGARSRQAARMPVGADSLEGRGGAKKAVEVKILLWGAPKQGKTAYLWALGQQFTERTYDNLVFTAKRPTFQEHWTRLDLSMRKGWERTPDNLLKIVGGELDLFGVCRRSRGLGDIFGRVRLEVTSMDIAGELIREVGKFKTDSKSTPELLESVHQQVAEASACFIIVRADEMLQIANERASSAMMIRQSISLLQQENTRTAIILTACDAISDQGWRDRLGFGVPGAGASLASRLAAARDLLKQCDPLILNALEKHSDVRVFPVSAWGHGEDRIDGKDIISCPDPRYIEDPLVWVLERELKRHEAMRSRRRRKASLWAASILAGLVAAASHVVVAPYVAAVGGVQGPLDAFTARLADMPAWVVSIDKSGMEPALYAEAVAAAQDGRFSDANASLAVLSEVGSGSYFRSRATLEIARIKLDKQLAADAAADAGGKAEQRLEFLAGQRSSLALASDRYARVVMEYRYLTAVALQARQPMDAPTAEVFEAMAKNKIVAVQHGGDLGPLLFAGWLAGLRAEPARLGEALTGLESLRRLIPGDVWAEVAALALKDLAVQSLDALVGGSPQGLLALIRWGSGQPEFHRSIAEACQQELETRLASGADSKAMRDRFADACVESPDLAVALQSLQLYVVDSLVERRDEKGLRQLRSSSVPTSSSNPALQMAAADWASMLPGALFQPNKSMDRLLVAYATDSGERNGDEAADQLARFEFVAGLFSKRAPAVAAHVSSLEAQASMLLALRPGFLEKLHPVRVRWVVRKAVRKGPDVDRQSVSPLAQSVADRAAAMPAASLAVIVEELVTSVGHTEFESASYLTGLRELANALVRQNVDSNFSNDSNSLMQVVVCWRVASPGSLDRKNFQVAALGIVNSLSRIGQWDSLASDALSRLLPDAEERVSFLAAVEKPTFLGGHLSEAFRSHLIAGRPEMAAAAFRSAHALDAAGLMSRCGADGKDRLFFGANMIATLPATLVALAAWPQDRSALLAMVCAELDLLAARSELDGSGLMMPLSRLLMQDDASVSSLEGATRAVLQERELIRAIRACARGNSSEAEESLGAAVLWQNIGPEAVSSAFEKVSDPIDAVLSGLLSLDAALAPEARARIQASDLLILAAVQKGGVVENGERLQVALERLVTRPIPRSVRSSALASIVDSNCVAAAKAGQWDQLLLRWQTATRLSRNGWIPDSSWPGPSTDVVVALMGSSGLVKQDGWPASVAEAALRKAIKSSDLDATNVWLLRERVAVAACCMVAQDPTQIPCDFESDLARVRPGSPASISRRFVLDMCAAMLALEDPSAASVAGALRIREGLAALLAIELQKELPPGWDGELFDSIQAKYLPPIAKSLSSLMRAPSRRDSKLALPNLLSLACSGRPESVELFSPSLESVLAGRNEPSLREAAAMVGKARSIAALPVATCSAMTAWLGKACDAAIESWRRADAARLSMEQLGELVANFEALCARSQVLRWSRDLQARLSTKMGGAFRGARRDMWDLAEEVFAAQPALLSSLASIKVDMSVRNGDIAAARAAAENLPDGPVSLHMRSFLADCASMSRVVVTNDQVVYLARREVTVREYEEFIKAIRADKELLTRLASEVGMRLSASRSVDLEKLMPGVTPPELSEPDLPVHKVSWWGARLYAAWKGHELPSVEALGVAWGGASYPWGSKWDPALTNSSERYASGQSVVLIKAPEGAEFHALHGNVAEFCSDASASGEVVIFGASAWSRGESVKRGEFTRVDTRQGARNERIAGYGFRTMLPIPDAWGVNK